MEQWICTSSPDVQLRIDTETGGWESLGPKQHAAWKDISQGRGRVDDQGVVALLLERGVPSLFVDGRTMALSDPMLSVELLQSAPGASELRISYGGQCLRATRSGVSTIVVPPAEDDGWPTYEPTAEELDFGVFLAARMAWPGFRENWTRLDAGPGALGSADVEARFRFAWEEYHLRAGFECNPYPRLGGLSIHGNTVRGNFVWTIFGRAASLRTFHFVASDGHRGVAVAFRLFDLSRTLLPAEEILVGWVEPEETALLHSRLSELVELIERESGLRLPIRECSPDPVEA